MATHFFNSRASEQHETPIKKGKDMLLVQPRTAESEQKVVPTLQSIEAQQLFELFETVVKITEDQQAEFDHQTPVSRKLQYESSSLQAKLQFSPINSSMKKRQKICYKSQTQHKFQGIVLFDADEKEKQMAQQKTAEKLIEEEAKFTTPKGKEMRELGNWATRKKVDRAD